MHLGVDRRNVECQLSPQIDPSGVAAPSRPRAAGLRPILPHDAIPSAGHSLETLNRDNDVQSRVRARKQLRRLRVTQPGIRMRCLHAARWGFWHPQRSKGPDVGMRRNRRLDPRTSVELASVVAGRQVIYRNRNATMPRAWNAAERRMPRAAEAQPPKRDVPTRGQVQP